MVKGAARSADPASSSSTPAAVPTMQAGQNASDPLTLLNSHRGFGQMAGFNPFADMGLNTADPNMVISSRCIVCDGNLTFVLL